MSNAISVIREPINDKDDNSDTFDTELSEIDECFIKGTNNRQLKQSYKSNNEERYIKKQKEEQKKYRNDIIIIINNLINGKKIDMKLNSMFNDFLVETVDYIKFKKRNEMIQKRLQKCIPIDEIYHKKESSCLNNETVENTKKNVGNIKKKIMDITNKMIMRKKDTNLMSFVKIKKTPKNQMQKSSVEKINLSDL